ncbi:MAG: hypothetical protein QOF60_3198 [Actinomycetota bacterium]|jgi:hypothetical protein|nr:hypothetical protein [Actinomycetota bacterium]
MASPKVSHPCENLGKTLHIAASRLTSSNRGFSTIHSTIYCY